MACLAGAAALPLVVGAETAEPMRTPRRRRPAPYCRSDAARFRMATRAAQPGDTRQRARRRSSRYNAIPIGRNTYRPGDDREFDSGHWGLLEAMDQRNDSEEQPNSSAYPRNADRWHEHPLADKARSSRPAATLASDEQQNMTAAASITDHGCDVQRHTEICLRPDRPPSDTPDSAPCILQSTPLQQALPAKASEDRRPTQKAPRQKTIASRAPRSRSADERSTSRQGLVRGVHAIYVSRR